MGFNPGGGGGSGSVAGGTDVALSNVQDNHFLGYDSPSSKWQNKANPTPSLANLPAGTMIGRIYSGSAWPARGTTRTDLIVYWIDHTGNAPAPSALIAGVDIFSSGGGGTTPPPSGDNTATAIIANNFGNHDAVPRGVPEGYTWKYDADANSETGSTGWQSWGATNIWGQVFVTVAGSSSTNYDVRFQVRNPQMWFWYGGTTWTQATQTPGALGGAYWAGDFDPNKSQDATKRDDGSGMWSVPLNALSPGTNQPDAFHWWWDGHYPRIPIPASAQGMLVRQEMRLIPADGQSSIGTTAFIANSGADLFETTTTVVHPQGWNPGIPQSRMKSVTGEWQTHYICTMSSAQITSSSPTI